VQDSVKLLQPKRSDSAMDSGGSKGILLSKESSVTPATIDDRVLAKIFSVVCESRGPARLHALEALRAQSLRSCEDMDLAIDSLHSLAASTPHPLHTQ
jgi:hypothetical protein